MNKTLTLKLDIENAKELIDYIKYNTPFQYSHRLEDLQDGEFIMSYCGIDFLIKK